MEQPAIVPPPEDTGRPGARRPARRLLASLLAVGALGAAAPAVASAIPVRDLRIFGQGENVVFVGARVFSPPTAHSCGARYAIGVWNPQDVRVRSRQGRLNVCRTESGAWTAGVVLQRFNVSDLPIGTYTVCVSASQVVNGRPSIHGICRARRI